MRLRTAPKAIAAAAFAPSFGNVASAQDAVNGEKVFKKCTTCHGVGIGARNKVGPSLNGIVAQPAAAIAGFKHSDARTESAITWGEATLGAFLQDPKAVAKGTKMALAGVKNDSEIADVIAFLNSLAADGTGQ